MSAFVLSATLHGVVVAILLLLSYAASQQVNKTRPILELVAGAGDNYGARQAPKLGTPGGVKLAVPTPPKVEAKETPPEPVKADLVKPAPVPPPAKLDSVAPTKPPETKAPDFKKQITRQVSRAVTKAKQQVEKERKAEEKRLADEAKKAKMTKEEFDKQNKTKAPPAKNPKIAKIDAEGIAQGVIDGSPENKTGGAGGKALTNDNDDMFGAWDAMLRQRVKSNFELPPGASDTLAVSIIVHVGADGTLSNFRVGKSSGSRQFDNAVIDAVRRTRMPAPPDGKSSTIDLSFSTRELDDR